MLTLRSSAQLIVSAEPLHFYDIMKTSPILVITQLFILSTEARLWQKISNARDLQERQSDDGSIEATTRIFGGGEAEEDRYSFTVSFQQFGSHFCGGSLIARDMVLSAAHCADVYSYDAVIGRHDHDEWDGDRVDVIWQYIHPNYSDSTNNYDIMVVKLSRPTSANVATVKLNSSNSIPSSGQSVTVVGWGVTELGSTSDELNEVEVTVVSQASCRSSYGSNLIKDEMLCAADPNQDSCQGDSGGPLFLKGADAESDVQVGVVSWGYGCADEFYPGVYARVSSAYDWIKDKVCEHSQDEDARSEFQCIGSSNSTPPPSPGGTFSTDDVNYDDINYDDFNYDDINYDDFSYDDDDFVDAVDNWWNSWTNTVNDWWNSWWN
mmetsp:Transcript_6478/g.9455  ORF Transcript_6478/g.9455 Transcript_6478/m.9455 type:complete len:379 (-) Transcript_6478:116-1252(-)